MRARETTPFTSNQNRWERFAALVWLPVHLFFLPALALWLFSGQLDETELNLLVYGAGGYRFTDFMKIGIPMNFIILIANLFITPIVFPMYST